MNQHPKTKSKVKQKARTLWKRFLWPRSVWRRVVVCVLLILTLQVGTMYGIARWYMAKHANQPMQWGVTFIPDYAETFSLDPQETMQAMISDLGIKHFRLVSYWEDIEPVPGQFDFSQLDWQFKKAEQAGVTVSLAIGLRQPRWPECHTPSWVHGQPKDIWYPELKTFMTRVVERYRMSPALDSYQLENEYFLKAFGKCTDFSRDRLVSEYNLVKSLDPLHTLIVSRSNNALGFPVGKPTPDMFGVSVYKRVWDKTITKRYFEYPFPAWFYGFLAGGGEILTGKDMMIHELQAEPWPPQGDITKASIAEQDKSLSAKRLADRLKYAKGTGVKHVDLWGAEWWYWRKVKFNDSTIWDTVKTEIQRANNFN